MKAEPPDKVNIRGPMVGPKFYQRAQAKRPGTNLYIGGPMNKYIGFDISSKDVSVCVIQKNQRERYATIGPDVGSMRKFLLNEKRDGSRVNVTFEISGQAGNC
jgi:hypothetical protein